MIAIAIQAELNVPVKFIGIGEKIEEMFLEEIAGPGAVRAVLKKYMA